MARLAMGQSDPCVFDYLNAAPPRLGKKLHGGHIALAAALAYASLRFEGKWEKGRSN